MPPRGHRPPPRPPLLFRQVPKAFLYERMLLGRHAADVFPHSGALQHVYLRQHTQGGTAEGFVSV